MSDDLETKQRTIDGTRNIDDKDSSRQTHYCERCCPYKGDANLCRRHIPQRNRSTETLACWIHKYITNISQETKEC